MILDSRNEFADATSVAAAAGTVLIGNVIDLGTDGLNDVDSLYAVISVDTEIATAAAAGTVQLFLVSDALATLGAGVVANCTTHVASPIFVTGATTVQPLLAAGKTLMQVELPKGQYERYLGILCTTGTTTTTTGKVNCFLTPTPVTQKSFDSPFHL
jgi:hypothetical protein